jgi:hypothetical protein
MIEPIKIGERVAVVLKKINEENKKIYLVGYGTYAGEKILGEKSIIRMSGKKLLFKASDIHHRIDMDDGSFMWEFNCWFHREKRFNELFITENKENWKVIKVTSKGKRRK